MPYNETKLDDKIEELIARQKTLERAARDVKHCCDAMIGIRDIKYKIPNPNPDPNRIGDDMIEEKRKPEDEQIGGDILDARRNVIYEKRMAQATKLLSKTV